MRYLWVWADGQFSFRPYVGNIHHVNLMQDMGVGSPRNFAGGFYQEVDGDPRTDTMNTLWHDGVTPTSEEIKFMLNSELNRFGMENEAQQVVAATIEDSEPPQNFGFLKDPHDELYPCVWKNKKMIPKAKKAMKDHLNNYLKEQEYADADKYMYWTVYGSGASYNWDEDGDFDLQLWVDYTKFKAAHPESELTADELLADIRRLVQIVNFPSFADLGLATKECSGSMIVQYYAKAGTGSEEENLAQKPYACYDIETDKWLVEPKPYGPSFYGEEFVRVEPKAKDIAVQAEALAADLDRQVASWMFWSQLGEKLNHPYYLDMANQAKDKAVLDKEAMEKLFLGVFKGRMDAYTEYGKGIEDERDAVEKMLEVWGTFQTLRHYVKADLPWDEQEMPDEKTAGYDDDLLDWWSRAPRVKEGERVPIDELMEWQGPYLYHSDMQGYGKNAESMEREGIRPSGVFDKGVSLAPREPMANFLPSWKIDVRKLDPDKLVMGVDEIIYLDTIPPSAMQRVSSFQKTADWSDIMQKAKRLKDSGQVSGVVNNGDYLTGQVIGDHGTYNPEIWRDDPNAQAITRWTCPCEWGQYSWGRTRQWKKFEGRPCAHTLALFWSGQQTQPQQGQSPPPADVGPQPGLEAPMSPVVPMSPVNPQPQIPAPMTPVGPPPGPTGPPTMIQQGEQASEQQLAPEPAPPPQPAFSQKTQFGQSKPDNIGFPGSLSHTKRRIIWRDPADDSGYYLPKRYAMGLRGDLPENLTFKILPGEVDWNGEGQHRYFIKAYIGDEMVGELGLEQKRNKPNYYILGINVEEPWQRRGIAEAMFLKGEEITGHPIHHDWEVMSDEGEQWANEMDKRHTAFERHPRDIEGLREWVDQHGPIFYHTLRRTIDAYFHRGVGSDAMVPSVLRQGLLGADELGFKPNIKGEGSLVWLGSANWFEMSDMKIFGPPQFAVNVNHLDWDKIAYAVPVESVYGPFYVIAYNGNIPTENISINPQEKQRFASFQNGERVRARYPMIGIDRAGQQHKVPANAAGEVLYSDEEDAYVIFPLKSGKLEPHLVRVRAATNDFYPESGSTPFIKRHTHTSYEF